MHTDLSLFATSTFQAQRAQIDALSSAPAARAALIEACASLQDAEPLSYLLCSLANGGALRESSELEASLLLALSQLPDANLAKVLRSLERLPSVMRDPKSIQSITIAAANALRSLPIERVAAICFLDRWIKNIAPALRADLCERSAESLSQALSHNTAADVQPKDLLLATSSALRRLHELAQTLRCLWWDPLVAQFAQQVLSILAAAPKSLSQANAEEILSKRVYTDPGHFFIELLQNAEDAKASAWRVSVQPSAVSLWHDGVAFDAKDVVGVLSIGQTTKAKGQIGFFGVGFKSVYEVTDRPQIYSGPYLFEIADVSLPKRLSQRPKDAPEDGTLLILPLRPEHNAKDLYKKLSLVPPQTLLMLDSLHELALSSSDSSKTIKKTLSAAPLDNAEESLTIASLFIQETQQRESYLIERGRFAFSGDRESSRVSETPVLIAVLLDEELLPRPLPEATDTIFSYLPTKEQSGLRFLLHAHFDLPVDRERLHLGSRWNQWALSLASALLWDLLHKLTTKPDAEALRAMLSVLPLPQDATHAAFQQIANGLKEKLSQHPLAILPGAAGELLAPKNSCKLEDQSLAPLLRGMQLGAYGAPLAPLSAREEKVALFLGASRFGGKELVDFLSSVIPASSSVIPAEAGIHPVAPSRGVVAPPWLPDEASIGVLLHSLGSIQDTAAQNKIRQLALLPVERASADAPLLLSCAPEIFRASPMLRRIYQSVVTFIPLELDTNPTFAQERLFQAIGLEIINEDRLLRDLQGELRHKLLAAREHLWRYIATLPLSRVLPLAALPLFETQGGQFLPLTEGEIAYLPSEGPLASWFDSLSREKPPVLSAELLSMRSLFLQLGAKALNLSTILSLLQDDALQINTEEAISLHLLLDEISGDLTPKLCEQLSRTTIFPDSTGTLRRALRLAQGTAQGTVQGDSQLALLAEDGDVIALAPDAPWLNERVAVLSYLRLLPISRIGAVAVAETLLFERELFDPLDPGSILAAYSYLLPRVHRLSGPLRIRLGDAPIWLSLSKEQLALTQLRQPPASAALRALYSRWRSSPLIDDAALSLSLALGLRDRLTRLDHNTLLEDLLRDPPDMTSDLRGLVLDALSEAAHILSRSDLLAVRQAKIFRASNVAAQQPLGTWEARHSGGCLRVSQELRSILTNSSLPLLSEEDEADLARVLSTLGDRVATIVDVISVASEELSAWSEASRAHLRSLLIRHQSQLATIKTKLAPLAIWPTQIGGFAPSSSLVRAVELRRLLGDDSWSDGSQTLAKDAEEDAEALQSLFTFKAPLEIVVQKIRAEAKPNEPLSAQPPFLSNIGALVRLLSLLSRRLDSSTVLALPLWVDRNNNLQTGPRLCASTDEALLVEGLSLESELASEAWRDALWQHGATPEQRASLAPSLSIRRFLNVLAELSREIISAPTHPIFATKEKREALYRWVLQNAKEIEDDAQALGILGRACVILAPSQSMRSPRDYLFIQEPDGLSLDWSPHEEVPGALLQWMRRVYRVEEQRLGQVVQKLLEAHEEAITARALARSAPLLRVLSSVLSSSNAGDLSTLVERFRVVKTLRVESETNEITKPKKLFATSSEKWELLTSFMQTLPERPAARYQEDSIIALLRAAGAKADLSKEDLQSELKNREQGALRRAQGEAGNREQTGERRPVVGATLMAPSAENTATLLASSLGFARYLGLLLSEDASLVQSLGLDKAAWLPDGAGQPREPRSLYWPTPEIQSVLGDDPALYPHPEFFLTMPKSLQQLLSFRTLQSANPEDIAARLARVEVAPLEVLRWLQQALQERRVEVAWVRALFQDRALLLDEAGVVRRSSSLLRESAHELFGPRRTVWPEAQKLSRLADAIGIPVSVGRREILAFLQEIAAEIAPDLLQREPYLRVSLLNCLSLLGHSLSNRTVGEGGPTKLVDEAIPLLVEDGDTQRICLSSEVSLRIPEPEEMYEKAKRERRTFLYVVLPEESRDEVIDLLTKMGIASLASPAKPVEKSTPHEEKKGLFARIKQMLTKDDDEKPAPSVDEDRPSLPPTSRGDPPPKKPTAPEGQPSSQEDWMRPRAAINEQLRGSPNWVESRARPPSFGFAFAPKDLPPPYRYAPMLIADRFDPRSQRWSRDAIQNAWEEPAEKGSASEAVISFKGKIPAGESILPLPLYGRLLQIEAGDEVRQLVTRDGQPLVRSPKSANLSYTVALGVAPAFLESAPAPSVAALQKKTVPDEDLPQEAHSFLLQLKGAPGLQKALEIRDFIRERYRYDPSYLEDPEVAKWLRQVSYHSANMHIAALHAGRDARHLGRGVCYELNALACELMRRAGVPAAVVTGWTLERGSATEPDHMWSVALLESDVGPRWLPIDASTTRDGRPLRVAHRPAGPWRAKAQNTPLPKAPRWMESQARTQRQSIPTAELFAVVRHLAALSGQESIDEEQLATRCRELLQDKDAAKRFLAFLTPE